MPTTRSPSRLPLAATFVVVALTSAAPAVAANAVPFSAEVITHEILHPDPASCPAFPFLAGSTTGVGTATHLGAVTGIGSDCITPTSPTTFQFGNGHLTVVAANGDELRAQYSGTLVPSALPPYSTISGSYRITGGTGRFAGATGGGKLGGIENLLTGQGRLTLSGTLSY